MQLFLTQTHEGSFRCHDSALIVGVEAIAILGNIKPCYLIKYPDGQERHVPIEDRSNYRLTLYNGERCPV